MSGAFGARSMKRKNVKDLTLGKQPAKTATPSAGDAQIPGAIGNEDGGRTDTLEIGIEFKLDLRTEDLIVQKELGAGNGGTVSKVMHAATKAVMARKIIHVEAKTDVRKRIVRELHIMHDCSSPYIVLFHGAFLNDTGDVVMCMEYMDVGSLDRISKDFGPVRVDVLGKIAEAILGGLTYLYNVHRIMHRDIKPSNVLVNSRGSIKLCDFGVSGELVNSIADTFVGTSTYMAPERIQGAKYSVKSDVWSVGLTLMELAIGRFPFDASESAAGDRASAGPMGILDLLQQIVHEPAPKLPKSDAFPTILEDMIQKCLVKEPEQRPTPEMLFMDDPFLQAAKRTPVNLEEWAVSMMEKSNRKSHLQQPLSPATKALLRDNSPPKDTPSAKTPTSGDIPIEVKPSPGPTRENHTTPRAPHVKEPNGMQPQPGSSRPGYPPRTSSASSTHSALLRGGLTSNQTTLPIRPAPPPAGPLPTPPGSNSGRPQSSGRPLVPRKSSYQTTEQEAKKESNRWQPTIPTIGKQYHQNGDLPPY
ncbi:MAG: MAP kinase kinase (MEK) [Candelina submexicana]|nr:MAG: MAP kinase kinase (MEK) [Candelina submexicana]